MLLRTTGHCCTCTPGSVYVERLLTHVWPNTHCPADDAVTRVTHPITTPPSLPAPHPWTNLAWTSYCTRRNPPSMRCSLRTGQRTQCGRHTALCTAHSAHQTQHCAHRAWSTIHTTPCSLHTAHCTLHTLHCVPYTLYTVHSVHCTMPLYPAPCAPRTGCRDYTALRALHIAHWALCARHATQSIAASAHSALGTLTPCNLHTTRVVQCNVHTGHATRRRHQSPSTSTVTDCGAAGNKICQIGPQWLVCSGQSIFIK